MAVIVIMNAKVLINAVDLSDHARKITINYKAAEKDSSAMGVVAMQRLSGLIDWDLDVEFNQDWAANKVDATMFPLVGGAAVAISIVPVNTTVAPTNPAYEGNAICTDYPPLGVSVGDLATTTVKLPGTGILTRRTA